MHRRKYSWVVSLALAALFAFPHAAGRYRASTRLIVEFDIAVEKNVHRPPVLQIFYDKGKGFKEQESFRVVLPEGGIRKHIQAVMPAMQLHALRLDYLNGPGVAVISDFKIMDSLGTPLLSRLPVARWATFQTQDLQEQGENLIVQANQQADDPHINMVFEPALSAAGKEQIWPNIVFGIKIFVILSLVLEMLFLLTGKSRFNDWISSIKAHPDK